MSRVLGLLGALVASSSVFADEEVSVVEKIVLRGHERWVTSVDFSPDGKTFLSAGDDHVIRLWSVVPSNSLWAARLNSPVTAAQFSPEEHLIIAGAWDGSVSVLDSKSGKVRQSWDAHDENVTSLAWSRDGQRVVTGSGDDTFKVWSVKDGEELLAVDAGNEYDITSVAFSPNGKLVLSGDGESNVTLWDSESGEEITTFTGHEAAISSVVFSPDGLRIASASWDNTIRVWDIKSEKQVALLSGHKDDVRSIVFSSDSRRIISASDDHSVSNWDVKTSKRLATLSGHTKAVTCVTTSSVGHWILSGSHREIRLWELSSHQEHSGEAP